LSLILVPARFFYGKCWRSTRELFCSGVSFGGRCPLLETLTRLIDQGNGTHIPITGTSMPPQPVLKRYYLFQRFGSLPLPPSFNPCQFSFACRFGSLPSSSFFRPAV
jgi:hypothetical protein